MANGAVEGRGSRLRSIPDQAVLARGAAPRSATGAYFTQAAADARTEHQSRHGPFAAPGTTQTERVARASYSRCATMSTTAPRARAASSRARTIEVRSRPVRRTALIGDRTRGDAPPPGGPLSATTTSLHEGCPVARRFPTFNAVALTAPGPCHGSHVVVLSTANPQRSRSVRSVRGS